MRRPVRPGSAIQLKAYSPPPPGIQYPSTVPIELVKRSMLTQPAAKDSNRQRFGRSISLDRIETALRMAYGGNMMQLTDLSRETVETDPHLAAVLNKRFGAVSCLPYEVRPASGYGVDKKKALFYASVAREQIQNMTHFRRSLRQLAWGLFDGRAALECFWSAITGPSSPEFGMARMAVTEIGWIHPRRLSFGPNRELVATEERANTSGGSFAVSGVILGALPPGKFIVWLPQMFAEYPEREGLAPRCLYWSFFKRYGQRERMILLELFGKPWRIAEVAEESTASPEELSDADEAIDGLGGSFSARMPRGVKLTVVQPGRTAGHVHQEVVAESDKQISKLVLGQTGTTDGVPAGLNSSQASVMQDEQLMILTSDAAELSEVIENQLIDPIIMANFGPSELPHAPTFVLRSDLPADRTKEIERLKGALDAGLELSLSEAYEISGFRQPERTEALLRLDQPPTPPLAPGPPASRPIIVWPEGTSPPAGEQQPTTPQASTGDGARDDAGVSVGSADQGTIMTVNEARAGQGLPPLELPDGSPDPDGGLTVAEFEAKRTAEPAGATGAEPAAASTKPQIPSLPIVAGEVVELMIRKAGDQWCVYSEDGSRKFGCYPTQEQAEDRLQEIESFKHMAEDSTAVLMAKGAAAEMSLRGDLYAVIAMVEANQHVCCAKQPDTVNGSVEDILDRGTAELQRAVNAWADQYVTAFEPAETAAEVSNIANRVSERLDTRPFARALERRLVHSVALGALDSWFDDDSGTTVDPPTFKAAAVPPGMVDPKFATMPFENAMRYFKGKNVITRATFDRMSAVVKQKAFTVAALSQSQMLHLVHAELARHVGKGADLRSFATSFKDRLASAGFTAPSAAAEANYIQTVFRTNVLGAYNAGRHERMSQPDVVQQRPYWQIRTVSDSRRRPNHARADGLVLRANDPFWQRAYPPFSFNCRCRVVSLSEQQAAGMVITTGAAIDYLPDPGFVSGAPSLLSALWVREQVLLVDRQGV